MKAIGKKSGNRDTRKSRIRGFTLIELLVVISIIALLLAILMPALNRAKIYAAQVVSLNLVRQVGIAISTYSVANNGLYPPNPVDGWYASPNYFNTTGLDPATYGNTWQINLALMMFPYLGNSFKPFEHPAIPFMPPAEIWSTGGVVWIWWYLGGNITTTYGLESHVTKMEDAPGTAMWSDHCIGDFSNPVPGTNVSGVRTNNVKRKYAVRFPDDMTQGGDYGQAYHCWWVPPGDPDIVDDAEDMKYVVGLNTYFNDSSVRLVPSEEIFRVGVWDYFPPMKSMR